MNTDPFVLFNQNLFESLRIKKKWKEEGKINEQFMFFHRITFVTWPSHCLCLIHIYLGMTT